MSITSTIPPHVELVLSAANTLDVEHAADAWATPAGLTQWLRENTGLGENTGTSSDEATVQEHTAAVRLREVLRQAIADRQAPQFGELATAFPLRVAFDDGAPHLTPAVDGVIAGIAQVLAAVVRSAYDGTWERIKICHADTCRWAFFDESRNRSRAWCSMQVCGNRTKTRTYRARHQPG